MSRPAHVSSTPPHQTTLQPHHVSTYILKHTHTPPLIRMSGIRVEEGAQCRLFESSGQAPCPRERREKGRRVKTGTNASEQARQKTESASHSPNSPPAPLYSTEELLFAGRRQEGTEVMRARNCNGYILWLDSDSSQISAFSSMLSLRCCVCPSMCLPSDGKSLQEARHGRRATGQLGIPLLSHLVPSRPQIPPTILCPSHLRVLKAVPLHLWAAALFCVST